MAYDYSDLNLDDILEIALADKNNSAEIDTQADAVSSLVSALEDTIRGSLDAHSHIDGNINVAEDPSAVPPTVLVPGPFGFAMGMGSMAIAIMESLSTNATSQQTKALVENGMGNLPALQPQIAAFREIANETINVHGELDDMRTERNGHIRLFATKPEHPDLAKYAIPEGATPEVAATKIRDYHNERARTRMANSSKMYVEVVEALPMPTPYEGPRMPRPQPPVTGPGNPGGNGAVTRPGPLLTRDLPPVTDLPPPPRPEVSMPPFGERPDLQGPGAPIAPPSIGHTPPPIPTAPPGGPGSLPPPVFVPTRPVTPPVIGNRGVPGGGRSPFAPNRTGLTRPVIGERPGKSNPAMSPRGSNPAGRGNTPLSGRGNTPPSGRGNTPPSGRGAPGRTATPPPGRGNTPAKGGSSGRATTGRIPPGGIRGGTPMPRTGTPAPRTPGVRAQPSAKPDTGPVRGRPQFGQRVTAAQPPRISRAPKMHHGGNDVNRPVIGRGKGTNKRRDDEVPTTVEKTESQWYDVSGTIPPVIGRKSDRVDDEHDPGDFITNHNLGRRDWNAG